MTVGLRIKRGTRSQLNAAAGVGGLAAGEPYLITDETRLAIGTANNAFVEVTKKFSANIGNGVLTSMTVTHNLNTYDVVVEVYNNGSPQGETVLVDVTRPSVNAVTLTFASPPATNAFRVVIIG